MRNRNFNIFLRILGSFILAIIVWYSINGSTSNIITRTIMNIPVSLTSMNELQEKGLTITNETNYFVNLELRGSETSLDQIDVNEVTAEVNLADVTSSGTVNLPIVINGLNNTVILDQTIPDTIQLDIEEITAKEFSPTIITQGKPAEGYSVISSTSSETVNVSGPQDQISRLDKITGIAQVEGLSGNSYQLVSLEATDEDGNILNDIEITPNTVEANIIIGVTKQVNISTPEVLNSPEIGYTITNVKVEPASIKIAGDPEVLENINQINVNPISFSGTSINRSVNIESDMIIPNEVSVIGNNAVATVKVYIEKVNEKELSISNIEVIGLTDGLNVRKIQPGSISVKVTGTSGNLSQLNNSNVKATVDVSGLGAGSYTLPVSINIPDVTIAEINPTNVEIDLINQS